jgi:pimeloyl-ACP methyl ester carboxylesterase
MIARSFSLRCLRYFERRPLLVLLFAAALSGCATNGGRIDEEAVATGLARTDVVYAGLRTHLYMKPGASGATLTVFLEGDGQPWRRDIGINFDPATGNPIALRLLTRTPGPVAYVVRPCYLSTRDAGCNAELWTSARYSEAVIDSMAAAIRDSVRRASAKSVALVGYSGGGALAVLVAERLDGVESVTTIGANLDIEAWTTHHRDLPLERSLNPARSEHAHRWRERHLQGARDAIVPPATTDAYFARYPNAQRRVIAEFDHVCCWLEAWPEILNKKE